MHLDDLDTPSVVCDLDVLDRNLAALPAKCRELGIPLLAHTKSHKIPELAHRQISSGCVAICCQIEIRCPSQASPRCPWR